MIKSLNLHLIARHFLNLLCLLFLVVPFFSVYLPLDEPESENDWTTNYIWNSAEVAIGILPFIILWILIQFQFHPKFQKLYTVLLYLIGGFYVLYFILVAMFPVQDLIPSFGVFLIVLILPTFVVYQNSNPKE